jgi:hypothetical protein
MTARNASSRRRWGSSSRRSRALASAMTAAAMAAEQLARLGPRRTITRRCYRGFIRPHTGEGGWCQLIGPRRILAGRCDYSEQSTTTHRQSTT